MGFPFLQMMATCVEERKEFITRKVQEVVLKLKDGHASGYEQCFYKERHQVRTLN